MILLSFDGVLRQPESGAPNPIGIALYRALTEKTSVAIVADDTETAVINHWLQSQRLTEHDYLVLPDALDQPEIGARRKRQMTRLRASGPIDLLIDGHPDAIAAAVQEGVPAAMLCHPAYSRPEHLPGEQKNPTPWSALLGEMDRQQEIRINDNRLSQEII